LPFCPQRKSKGTLSFALVKSGGSKCSHANKNKNPKLTSEGSEGRGSEGSGGSKWRPEAKANKNTAQAKEVKTNNGYLGLLPLRNNKNGLICPNGEFTGIWSSEELKYANENGYEIVEIKGYNFNKIEGMFNDFITNLYDKKRDSIGFLKLIYKQTIIKQIFREIWFKFC
jgi:hypothetical protein